MIFVFTALAVLFLLLGLYELTTYRKRRVEEVILGQKKKLELNIPAERVKMVLAVIGYAVFFFAGGWYLVGGVVWGAMMAGVGAVIPFLLSRERYEKKVRKMEKELEEALYQGVNVLRGGGGMYQFLEYLASDKTGELIRPHFRKAFATVKDLGQPPVEAFRKLADELPELKDLKMLSASFEEAQRNGADLSQVAEMFAEDTRNRRLLREEMVAKTTQGQLTALLLLGIGIGVPAVLKAFSFFTDNPTLGGSDLVGVQLMTFFCYVLMIFGFFFVRRMIRV
ncbi:hypothetical protein GCM10010965_29860 [Caldalkalibacillus thermarum]|uniref:type II secretion system F family protein n=1 Tax=Caldalkalibacillus thermarum TaxID=296745 RepID=UPI00166A3473|nr:type II secretion system F family protein [Caldalkalibacillus thermarum]GGK34949.1 hypothetical protein GCM10010965_29860 [Caldalkalibacillus thermarum]